MLPTVAGGEYALFALLGVVLSNSPRPLLG